MNKRTSTSLGLAGCLLPLIVLAASIVPSYLAAGYTLDYWGSQYAECPVQYGFLPKAGLTIVTPGLIFPAAVVTAIADQAKVNDVPPGPRALKEGIPLCNR